MDNSTSPRHVSFSGIRTNTYNEVVAQVLANKEIGARIPTGEQSAILLDETYNSADRSVRESPRREFVRKNITYYGWLWVPSVNVWTPQNTKNPGMYSVFDESGQGFVRTYTLEELEDRLNGADTERGVRFSKDRSVAFAPRNTIRPGEHNKGTLSQDGAFIAVYGPKGAEALDRVAERFRFKPSSWIVNNDSDKPIQTLSALYRHRYLGDVRLDANFDSDGNLRYGYVFSIALATKTQIMKTYKNLYNRIISPENLFLAWKKARKGKTRKPDVIEFEKNLKANLLGLHKELKDKTYRPLPLISFSIRDPKTRKISKSDFRDRIVHHAIVNILEPIYEKVFINDSCANRKGKGNLFALKRLELFMRKVSRNGKVNGWFNDNQVKGYCLKADVKHYFQEVNHNVLLRILERKIKDVEVMQLMFVILKNSVSGGGERPRDANYSIQTRARSRVERQKGMPLGNLTSQFFANIYLNELDYFVKRVLQAKFYIRYVDDFVILYNSKKQLMGWKEQIGKFLQAKLEIELHPDKSKIIPLSRGIDFVGFRNFYYNRLVRKRNMRKMRRKIDDLKNDKISYWGLMESFQGWQAYVKWANSFNLRKEILKEIYRIGKKRMSIQNP